MLFLLQQGPIVVEFIRQPPATRDVSIDAVLAMFALAGAAIAVAAVGGLVVGAAIITIKRMREADAPPADTSHVRLRI